MVGLPMKPRGFMEKGVKRELAHIQSDVGLAKIPLITQNLDFEQKQELKRP